MTEEKKRLIEDKEGKQNWRKFGPYLSERQWGTVREDYSAGGDAWNYITHDMARSKAYRWGEEGIAGVSDENQLICFAIALWNKKDPILKERLFGLSNPEGNHGEDCKEVYYYIDCTPSHSYMKMMYRYTQHEYPYSLLVEENKRRSKQEPEFEIQHSGVFDNGSYFDVFVEYAKAGPEDVLINITAHNRSSKLCPLHILPTAWFRNTWSWDQNSEKPSLYKDDDRVVVLDHKEVGRYYLYFDGAAELLFCDNETNTSRLYNHPSSGTFKDGINEYLVNNNLSAVSVTHSGTKVAADYNLSIEGKSSQTIRLRLAREFMSEPFEDFDRILKTRIKEADVFYAEVQKGIGEPAHARVQRQAFAGLFWGKQFYHIDVDRWLAGDPTQVEPPQDRRKIRNGEWPHLHNADIISMPDKWEYPWYAAWDLAFHCIPIAMVDPEFAKNQMLLLTKEWYMHPNGQLPAYEWSFSDVNPPVHAWAGWRVYKIDRKLQGKEDRKFLEELFHKLLLNFTWWVNKKDFSGNNIFQGGFLGMDNIGVFDRSSKLPYGGYIEQSDGTSWMAMFTLNMLRISIELAKENPTYQSLATKFFEHFLYIAGAMANVGNQKINLWDDEDEFFYDVLHTPQNERIRMKVRSMVGLIPLFAVEVLDQEIFDSMPEFTTRLQWFLKNRPDLANLISRWNEKGKGERHLLSLLRGHRMKRLLHRMLDESEFLSTYGIRSMSKFHDANPYILNINGNEFAVKYNPGESDSYLFGGNSNWRGPIWFPVNFLIIESLERFYHYYGDDFLVEHPTGSGQKKTLKQIADDLACRLINIFAASRDGKAVFADQKLSKTDKDYILFYEYFHGDDGHGLGASHQTGWTGFIAKLIQAHHDA